MSRRENIAKAIMLVDRMRNLSEEERQVLRKRATEAALGDDLALGSLVVSSYDLENKETIREILYLILQDDELIAPGGQGNGSQDNNQVKERCGDGLRR